MSIDVEGAIREYAVWLEERVEGSMRPPTDEVELADGERARDGASGRWKRRVVLAACVAAALVAAALVWTGGGQGATPADNTGTTQLASSSTTATTGSTESTAPLDPSPATVSYLSPPQTLALRPLAIVPFEPCCGASAADVAIGDQGVVVNQSWLGRVTKVGFDGSVHDIPIDAELSSIVYGPGDMVYGLRQGESTADFAMVAVPLDGEQRGTAVAVQPMSVVRYVELPVGAFGHGADGIVDRARDVNATVMQYADSTGAPLSWPLAGSPMYTASYSFPAVTVSQQLMTWELSVDAAPGGADGLTGPTPPAPSNDNRAVWWTHIGPATDTGEPTLPVVAELRPNGTALWWSLPDGWSVVASDGWGTVVARIEGASLELALIDWGDLPTGGTCSWQASASTREGAGTRHASVLSLTNVSNVPCQLPVIVSLKAIDESIRPVAESQPGAGLYPIDPLDVTSIAPGDHVDFVVTTTASEWCGKTAAEPISTAHVTLADGSLFAVTFPTPLNVACGIYVSDATLWDDGDPAFPVTQSISLETGMLSYVVPTDALIDPTPMGTLPSFVVGYARWITDCCYLKLAVENFDPPMPDDEAIGTFTANGLEWTLYDSGPRDGTQITAKGTNVLGTVLVSAQVRFPRETTDPAPAQRVVEDVAKTVLLIPRK